MKFTVYTVYDDTAVIYPTHPAPAQCGQLVYHRFKNKINSWHLVQVCQIRSIMVSGGIIPSIFSSVRIPR